MHGQHVLVVGASGGIGLAVAQATLMLDADKASPQSPA
jgi:NAD(P)-dependent dehydrogenase (short-subunit alcohol dehydrogenase family)